MLKETLWSVLLRQVEGATNLCEREQTVQRHFDGLFRKDVQNKAFVC